MKVFSFKPSPDHSQMGASPSARHTRKRPRDKPFSREAWPADSEWANRQEVLAARTARKLGSDPKRAVYGDIGASQVLDVLGADAFAEVPCVRTPGRVIWCNFELAGTLGFAVPLSNRMTPEFHEQLLDAFSYRAIRPGKEDAAGEKTITLYADMYGGSGVRPGRGACRAGFLPFGNLYIKGIGLTSLFQNDPNDFVHSHGSVHLDDCLSEAVFGEVNENIFTQGSTRAVAIIDQGQTVTFPSANRKPVALLVRTGTQLRPAHLLIRSLQGDALLEKFIRMVTATGQLVSYRGAATGRNLPDFRATMLRVIDDHARTAAEQFRWRIIHGALSSSNMELSGAMLDLPTQSSQPRTAPIWSLDYPDSIFGREHIERVNQLIPVYRKLVRNIPPSQRSLYKANGIKMRAEMDKAYHRHLQVKLLCAVGLKTEVAVRIQAECSDLSSRFMALILKMVELKNRGSVRITRSLVESVSVLDVFHLLGSFPQRYFAKPNADHTRHIRASLKPIYKGAQSQVLKKQLAVEALIKDFANLYRELMQACEGYAKQYYGDWTRMQSSIRVRAAFENQPLDALYSKKLYSELNKAIAAYRANGDVEILREAIDRRILVSLRSVDALLAQGRARRLPDDGIEMEMCIIDGISYSVRAWNDARQKRRLHVCIPVEREQDAYLTPLPNLPRLTKRQIRSLRYRFTTDGWLNSGESGARLAFDERNNPVIEFENIRTFPPVGQLEGAFYLGGSGDFRLTGETPLSGGYRFAIPDQQELIKYVDNRHLCGHVAFPSPSAC